MSNSCPGLIPSIWRKSAGKTICPLAEMVVWPLPAIQNPLSHRIKGPLGRCHGALSNARRHCEIEQKQKRSCNWRKDPCELEIRCANSDGCHAYYA